ncbi:MAG: TIGR02757 family protein [bacterium]
MKLKDFLDELVIKYEVSEFIKDDPVQFPHKFQDFKDIEIAGLIASSFAYGKRDKIIETVNKILIVMENEPYNFVNNFNIEKDAKLFEGFCYRYNSGGDIILLIESLRKAYNEYNSLEKLFLKEYSEEHKNIKPALNSFVNELRDFAPDGYNPKGFYFLLPSPLRESACKRLNLFLKWMVRKQPVDLALWKSVKPSQLIMPLDVHVAKQSRKLGLTQRKADDWKTAEEITDRLRQFDAEDPVKYDFAIFGMGVYKDLPDFSDIELN